MATQYPHSIRHRVAFAAWHAAGRKVNADVLAKAKCSSRQTLYTWRDAEGWATFADELDQQGAKMIKQVYETALSKHLKDIDTLLSTGRSIVAQAEREILNRLVKNHSVDMIEVRQLTSAIKALVDAGAIHYNLKTLNINHGGEIKVTADVAAEIEDRLRRKIPGLSLIDYAKGQDSAAA